MKKYLAIILSIALCLCNITVLAEGEFTLRVETPEARAGEQVEVDFILENNPGVIALQLVMDYDDTRLKLVEAKDCGLVAGAVFGNDYNKIPFTFVWASASHTNFDKDGVLATLVFEVLEDAPSGNAHIVLQRHARNILNVDLEEVPLTLINGGVNVVEKDVQKKEESNVIGAEEKTEVSQMNFSDVDENEWFYLSVKFASEKGWMSGISETEFAPLETLTRGMIVSILHRIEGTPESGEADFNDVPSDAWYAKGVAWAAENQIVQGIGDGLFAPNDNLTREQLFTILYHYAKTKGIDTSLEGTAEFGTESQDVSSWAVDATSWVLKSKILDGDISELILPKEDATRATVAVMLKNFAENM